MAAVNEWSSGFWRLLTPSKLFDKATIRQVTDEGANLLNVAFMYGERDGKTEEIGYDDSEIKNRIDNLATQSLWLYTTTTSAHAIPEGITEEDQEPFNIGTGRTRKCPSCRGTGKVTCSTCGGKIRWTENSWDGKSLIHKTCSCGDGKERCGYCNGYSIVQFVIVVQTRYRITRSSKQEYDGEIPKDQLAATTGRILFKHTVDYPLDDLTRLLTGGVDAKAYTLLQDGVRMRLHDSVRKQLSATYDGDLQLVHDLVDRFFAKMPDACKENKLLEYEIIPIRLRIKVENAPVFRITYEYKDNEYTLWVYGNEKRIHAPERPVEFTAKMLVFLGVISTVVLGIGGLTGLVAMLS